MKSGLPLLSCTLGLAVCIGQDLPIRGERESTLLPQYQIITASPVEKLTISVGKPYDRDYRNWSRSHGDSLSSRYSGLHQINRTNVAQLKVAWIYHSKDGAADVQCNPIIVDGVMYAPTAGNRIVAVDASTGREIWGFHPGGKPALRGLLYWKGNGNVGPRLFFPSGSYLWALDPINGRPIPAFGDGGKVAAGGVVAPAIYERIIVVPVWNIVKAFDVLSGKLVWQFPLIKNAAGADGKKHDAGANCWGGMAVDSMRGIAYISTGSPHDNFIGIDHPGNNLYANCVVALDVKTGKHIWHFQEIRHDIWDLDIPAPPNLVTIVHANRQIDAVAQVTKLGNTLLLDRVTGKSIFPFRLRRAPASRLAGEQTSLYQPDIELPQPFARQEFSLKEVTDLSPEAHLSVINQIAKANFGWFQPFEPDKATAFLGVHGGAEWTGAAFDPNTHRLFVSANELPWLITVSHNSFARDPNLPLTRGQKVYHQHCSVCHGRNREGAGVAPPLNGLGSRLRDTDIVEILAKGRNSMPPIRFANHEQESDLLDYLFDRDVSVSGLGVSGKPSYTYNGYPKLLDANGYPGVKPPWGTLNAIDLDSGKIVWKTPLGEYEELTKRGIPVTGTENFGGPTVTAGGLVFCAGTRDLKIRAFDSDTGIELWSYKLPYGGFAPPSIYEVNGRQHVVIAASGGGKLGGATGDTYVSFTLPATRIQAKQDDNFQVHNRYRNKR